MYAVEFIIARLKKQIELAPSFAMDDEPGGSLPEMLARLQEGINLASRIDVIRAVEGGPRRYKRGLEGAKAKLEPLVQTWQEIDSVVSASYADGEQRKKAMERVKEHPRVIVTACRAAIADLEAALAVIEEGECREVKVK